MACEHPITELHLPSRAINALHRGGVRTLEEAATWHDKALLELPQFGRVFLSALRNAAHQLLEDQR